MTSKSIRSRGSFWGSFRRKIHAAILASLSAALLALPAVSQAESKWAETKWTLSGVGILGSGHYVGRDGSLNIVPSIGFRNDYVAFTYQEGLSYEPWKMQKDNGVFGNFSVNIRPHFAPNFGDDPIFDGLDRKMWASAGAKGEIGWAFLFASAEALTDVTGAHGGYEANAALGVRQRWGPVFAKASLGAKLRSGAYGTYLYGVDADETTASRPRYTPDDETSPFASVSVFAPISDRVSLIGAFSYDDLSAYGDSPLLDEDNSWSLIFGTNYTF